MVKGASVLRDSGLWACVGVGYECEFVIVGVCGEGVDMSAGQVCECGENKTWTWEWMWVWCGRGDVWIWVCGEGVGCECVRRRAERSLQGCKIK